MKYNKFLILILLLIILPISVDARSGCCSHHGGVSHCDTSVGKYRCNDGTVSPSCVCEGTVQTTKRKTTRKQTTIPTTKRTTVKTETTRIIPTTTSYTTTVTTTEVIEPESSTTTMTKVVESPSERTSENVKKDNENTEEDTSPIGIIGGIGVISAVSWYVAKKKKLV